MRTARRNPTNLPGGSACLSYGRVSRATTSGGDVVQLLDHRGNDFGNATPGERAAYTATGFNGRPCVETDGTTSFIYDTGETIAPALIGGEDTPFTAVLPIQYTGSLTPAANARLWGAGGGITHQSFFSLSVSTSGNWRCSKRGESGGTTGADGVAADNDPHIMVVRHTGTQCTLYDEDLNVLVDLAQNVPSLNVLYVVMGRVLTLSVDEYGAGKFGDWALYAGALSLNQCTRIVRNLRNQYGI